MRTLAITLIIIIGITFIAPVAQKVVSDLQSHNNQIENAMRGTK